MSKKTPFNKKNRYVSDFDSSGDVTNAVSATDCTGLIRAMPHTEEEHESYDSVYDYRPPYGRNF